MLGNMHSQDYSSLRNTWIYQQIQSEVISDIQQAQRAEYCEILLEIIQARFPRLLERTKQLLDQQSDHPTLPLGKLVAQIGSARNEKEARQRLLSLEEEEQEVTHNT